MGERILGRPRHRWEDNIIMGLREIVTIKCDPWEIGYLEDLYIDGRIILEWVLGKSPK
jgi:hypothetical protein